MEFGDLKKGWHYGEGAKFSESAIEEAIQVHRQITFAGCDQTNAFPGPNGEIQITVYNQQDCFEFERDQTGQWAVIHEQNGIETESTECLSLEQVVERVRVMKSTICNAYAFYPSVIIGTPRGNVSAAWPLRRLPTTVESPCLTETVH